MKRISVKYNPSILMSFLWFKTLL